MIATSRSNSVKEEYVDEKWATMLDKATEFQQEMYEQLPDWTSLTLNDVYNLRKYISIAITGTYNYVTAEMEKDTCSNSDFDGKLNLNAAQNKEIDAVTEIMKSNAVTPEEEICFGVIYIVIFRCKSKAKNDDDKMLHIPIFRVRKYTSKNTFDTWYIDTNCRVYKSWDDYQSNNKLPPCTMVYPHDGYYQPNFDYAITEDYSHAWVSYRDSPSTKNTFTKIGDVASTILGVAGLTLAVASAVTPIGPAVVVSGAVGGAASGLWSVGRNSGELYDRYKHNQSIGLGDETGRKHWLGIVGSVAGAAVSGGSTLIAKAAANGKAVGIVGRAAYNTALTADIIANGAGIGLMVIDMHKQYKETNSITDFDILMLCAHVFFFGSGLLNARGAKSIIDETQGGIVEAYKKSLSSKRFRKSFKRVQKKCFNRSSTNVEAQNEIVRHINNVTSAKDLIGNVRVKTVSTTVPAFTVTFANSELMVDGIALINVALFAKHYVQPVVLLCARKLIERNNNVHSPCSNEQQQIFTQLMQLFEEFMSKKSSGGSYRANCTNPSLVAQFKRIVNDMKFLKGSVDMLPGLFTIVQRLIELCNGSVDIGICDGIEILWHYLITCIEDYSKRACMKLCDANVRDIALKIINTFVAGSDIIMHNLISGFKDFQRHNVDLAI